MLLKLIPVIVLLVSGSQTIDKSNEKAVEEFMQKGNVPGLFLVVVKGDSVIYRKGFGVTDIQTKTAVTGNTGWELGSISKSFVAEMIIDLYDKKLLDLDDPITKYLKGAPLSWENIRISHLLTHSSGIQNYLLDPRFQAARYFSPVNSDPDFQKFISSVNRDSLVTLFYSLPVEFEPGKTWSYSNTGYYLLGKIVESVTGMDFFEYTTQNLLEPLGMSATKKGSLNSEYLAQGYMETPEGLREALPLTGNYASSAGAWVVTSIDMVQYLKAYHKKRLPSDRAGIRWEDGSHADHPFLYNGGRFFSSHHGRNYIYHNGGTPGFSSSWIHETTDTISVVILMNKQDYAPVDQLARKILSHYIPDPEFRIKAVGSPEAEYWELALTGVIDSLKEHKHIPDYCSEPLRLFLESENGRGLWNWYFSGRFPEFLTCVEIERSDEFNLFHFLAHSPNHDDYPLIAAVNRRNQLVRIIWW